jgi:hypothetical protein
MPGPHDKIIASAAKSALGYLGFRRKGQFRLWLADKGWWLAVVEFQPSSWSKGSYLNVAAHWLWSDMGHVSFDFGGRVAEFEPYQSDDQFERAASRLAERAAEESRKIIDAFPSVIAAAELLLIEERNRSVRPYAHWSAYHAGIAAGIVGRIDDAKDMFKSILNTVEPSGSVLHLAARKMSPYAGDAAGFRREVNTLISKQRQALKLPDLSVLPF